MAVYLGNDKNRFGSAAFVTDADLKRAGLFDQKPDSLFLGFSGKRPIWYRGAGGLITLAGARGGKLRDVLAYNICSGILASVTMLILDMKGELAAISRDQTRDRKYCIYWNPLGLHGLPAMRLNPTGHLRIDSPTLVSDLKVFIENAIPLSGSPAGQFFERRAQEFAEAICLTLIAVNGVLTLPDLYTVINLIPAGGDPWLDFAFEMQESRFPIAVRVEAEIANSRDDEAGGFQGILGELLKSFAALSDPILLESVSAPFDFDLADLCASDRRYQFYLMPPAEFIGPWGSVIKAILVAAMTYKSRAPSAPRQVWILDECAQLDAFPLVPKMFTYGAGIGICPWAVYQSGQQMNATGKDAKDIIMSSASVRQAFAIRDLSTAQSWSSMLGAQSLHFDDERQQAVARHAKTQAMQSLLSGGDPIQAGLNYAYQKQEATRRSVQHRLLRTPDELLSMPPDKQILYVDGLGGPIYADRRPYYEQRFMAGRYHPNPYHPPAASVSVKTRWGYRTRRVVTGPVSKRFAHYPQYASGTWSRIDG